MRRRETGFSTLEVIAAVAIIAIALIPIISLQTQITRSEIQLEETQADTTAARNALVHIRDINPMSTPGGERQLDEQTTISWNSTPASPLRQSVNPTGFEVRLYRINAAVERRDQPVTTLQFDLVGWRPIAESDGRAQTE